jgi:hypothetical protein
MNRKRNSPVDIVAITLGVLASLLVVGSIVGITRGRMAAVRFPGAEVRAWSGDGWEFSLGGAEMSEEDKAVDGSFTEVEVRNVAGSIEVIGTGDGPVRIHSVKRAATRAGLDGLHVEVREMGGRLVVEERRDAPASGWQRSVSFTVTVPRSVKIVRAHSVSGSVRVSGAGTADQWLQTVSGSIATDGAAGLHASSTSGSVAFVFAGKVLDARTVSGSLEGTIDSVERGGSVSLRSVSGSVRVQAFDGLDASLDLRSVSGSVSCDFPLTLVEQKRTRLAGRIGQGSVPVEISTTSGTIRLGKK